MKPIVSGGVWRGVAHMLPIALAMWAGIFYLAGWTAGGRIAVSMAVATTVTLAGARAIERHRNPIHYYDPKDTP